MKTWMLIGISAVVILIGAFVVAKKVSPVDWGWWGSYNSSGGVALKGYDPVAYFKISKPVRGSDDHTFEWRGVKWQFSSAENRELFSKSPEIYAPQFGGFCSFAVSKGFTADISPDAWKIEGGKLYVFADQTVRNNWVASLGEGSLKRSEANWAKR